MHVQTNEQLTSESVNNAIYPALEDKSSMHASDDDVLVVSSIDDNSLNGYQLKSRIHLPMIFIFLEEVVLILQSH